ncbi:MAG TPA: M23 family metallopeptidase [Paenibacillaceae bacterium]
MDVRRNVRRRRKERLARLAAGAAADPDRPAGEEAGENVGAIGAIGETDDGANDRVIGRTGVKASGGVTGPTGAMTNEGVTGRTDAVTSDGAISRADVKGTGGAIARTDATANDAAQGGVHAGGDDLRSAAPPMPPSARKVIGARLPGGAAARPRGLVAGNAPADEDARPPENFPDPLFSDDPETWWKERMKRRETDSDSPADGGSLRFFRGLAVRVVWALVLFGAVWGWLRFELPGAALVRLWLSAALTEEMDARAVRAWYERHFAGSPAFLQQLGSAGAEKAETIWSQVETTPPVDGRVVQTFAESGVGVRLAAPAATPVRAVYAGLVMQVTGNEDGTSTVLIRHPNRIVTVYGNIAKPDVRPGDWVETGQTIGRLAPSGGSSAETFLDFAVRQNGKALDPAAVIPLD